ncbi:hypothetical protein HYDPIDRAFT_117926 [Hydnomerulius pinastri MD-312]|uniref:Uncharacterized protein n=1 Tax=Hydnomerulius pinastri MD-312 TaxID=994086 RepID=A0A0C9W9Y5_9AGAM|nr:hypothetical protein HYDPIDRAFT_117926 [Hydnomerulius pinastri MD-312]
MHRACGELGEKRVDNDQRIRRSSWRDQVSTDDCLAGSFGMQFKMNNTRACLMKDLPRPARVRLGESAPRVTRHEPIK